MLDTGHAHRILAAVRPRGRTRLENALAGHFSLTFADSLASAVRLLESERFQLILCGTNFDESRMFELLRHAKAAPLARELPFVCIKIFEGILHDGSYDSVERAVKLLGAAAFVDLAQWRVEYGKEQAAQQLRAILAGLIADARAPAG